MSRAALGLAEHETKHVDLSDLRARYVSKIVSEPPSFKLISFEEERWYVPLPWTHYLLLKNAETKKRTWYLYSLYMSPRHLTNARFRKVSQPIVTNLFNAPPIFRPCQNNGTKYQDINKIITSFWDGEFNEDLRPHGHPVVLQIQKLAKSYTPFDLRYFKQWEKLSIEELLAMEWPQNMRI